MIAFLKGEMVGVEKEAAIMDVGGVGYRVWVPASTLGRLPAPGEEVVLFTRLIIRDDEMQLFGFQTGEELSLFQQLVSVSGVGPKGAMAILSNFRPQALRGAVTEENDALLAKAPGVGKKTARRIILELKDKLGPPDSVPGAVEEGQVPPGAGDEAVGALVNLGYRRAEARSAVSRAGEQGGPGLGLEELIKRSLKMLDNI